MECARCNGAPILAFAIDVARAKSGPGAGPLVWRRWEDVVRRLPRRKELSPTVPSPLTGGGLPRCPFVF
jgi:hypothetical protein